LRASNARLAESESARVEAEKRANALSAAAAQLADAQRELAAARSETAQLNSSLQAVERDRTNRISQLQQENAAISARLRQAQGTLDQIAAAARLINGGPVSTATAPSAPVVSAAPAAGSPVSPAPRYHTVSDGDSLTRISTRYYGTASRWQEIYDANREVLKGENSLRPGQRLRIP
jgi:nucleoid-associated protein YgaU